MKWFLIFLGLLVSVYLPAQQSGSLDWDIDTIFDEPPASSEETDTNMVEYSVKKLIKKPGYSFGATYGFTIGLSNGWYEAPWYSNWHKDYYYLDRGIKLYGSFSIDAQLTEIFRAISTISFEVPDYNLALGDFFFDYNFYDRVFFRGGKYNLSWGISPYFNFTNILARVPKEGFSGDSYIFKADIPIGIGGAQVLILTRADLMHGVKPQIDDFGIGGKYNLALRWADFDLGVYYKDNMPLRGFLSIKTTIGKAELYNEWLVVYDLKESSKPSGAVNLGFASDLFGNRLSLAGEVFYNAEGNAYWYRPGTSLQKPDISPFIEGFNIAFNMAWRPWDKGNPRFFVQALYLPEQNSARLIPGFRLTPLPNLDINFTVPMALGKKTGYYYSHTVSVDDKGKPLPFAIALLVTLKGNIQAGHY